MQPKNDQQDPSTSWGLQQSISMIHPLWEKSIVVTLEKKILLKEWGPRLGNTNIYIACIYSELMYFIYCNTYATYFTMYVQDLLA